MGPRGLVLTAVHDVPDDATSRGGLILVVDDLQPNRDLVARALASDGHVVRHLSDEQLFAIGRGCGHDDAVGSIRAEEPQKGAPSSRPTRLARTT